MKSTRRSIQSAFGFSIVEMIAVVAIIAILIGLLVPALSQVQKMAATVSQKAQFSSISMGLEGFREDMGDYPDSRVTSSIDYQGAQKLAEAMIGMDGFGFHPNSRFRSDGTDAYGEPLYRPFIDLPYIHPTYPDWTLEKNIASRKGPYLELDTANAVKLKSIYPSGTDPLLGDTFILADKFKTVKNIVTGKKTGMPILYYKADTIKTGHSVPALAKNRSTYSYRDNEAYITLSPPFDSSSAHDMTAAIFYAETANPNFTERPHNSESFILLSAGPDGFYGTADDVYNFEKDK